MDHDLTIIVSMVTQMGVVSAGFLFATYQIFKPKGLFILYLESKEKADHFRAQEAEKQRQHELARDDRDMTARHSLANTLTNTTGEWIKFCAEQNATTRNLLADAIKSLQLATDRMCKYRTNEDK